jgi:hypothetical protein
VKATRRYSIDPKVQSRLGAGSPGSRPIHSLLRSLLSTTSNNALAGTRTVSNSTRSLSQVKQSLARRRHLSVVRQRHTRVSVKPVTAGATPRTSSHPDPLSEGNPTAKRTPDHCCQNTPAHFARCNASLFSRFEFKACNQQDVDENTRRYLKQ